MTARQSILLDAIINEFIRTAEAVGSVNLANKHHLQVSPATIRNEMADLVDMGYLAKPHSSSGRIPTTLGYKHFIENIAPQMEEVETTVSTSAREDIFQKRFDTDELLYEALNVLARETKEVALALLDNRIYYSGLGEVLTYPEYNDTAELQNLMFILEHRDILREALTNNKASGKIKILFGDDTGLESFLDTSIIYGNIRLHGDLKGFLAVVGPTRMNYVRAIPLMDFMIDTVNEVIGSW